MEEDNNIDMFIPESIEINNFNNIKHLLINLKNMNIVHGKNGSGKTSIADAFDFCLTGSVMRNVKNNEVITYGEKKATVTIVGSYTDKLGRYDNERVVIKRVRDKRKQEVKIFTGSGDDITEIISTDIDQFLSSVVTHIEFKKIYYIHGHSISQFLNGKESEYSKMLDQLFSIDSLDIVIKEIKTNKLNSDISLGKAKLTGLESKKKIHSQKNEIIRMRNDLVDEKKTIEMDIPAIESNLETFNTEIRSLREELGGKVDELNDLKTSSRYKESIQKEFNDLVDNIKKLNARKKILEKALSKIKAEDGFNSYEDANNSLFTKRGEITKLELRIDFRKDLPNFFKKMMVVDEDGDACPLCLSEGMKKVAMDLLSSKNEESKSIIQSLREQRVSLKENSLKLEKTRNRMKTLETNLDQLKLEKGSKSKNYTRLKGELEEIGDIDEGRMENLESCIKDLQVVNDDKTEVISNLSAELRSKQSRLDTINDKINNFSSTSESDWMDEDEITLKESAEMVEIMEGKVEKLLKLKKGMKEVLSSVRDRFIATINKSLMERVSYFGGKDNNISSFQIHQKITKQSGGTQYYYDFKVEIDDHDVPFDSLSTGQKSVILFSLIMSIVELSSNSLMMIIFDEIDSSGMDKDRLKVVLTSILELSNQMKVVFMNRDAKIIKFMKNTTEKLGIDTSVVECKPMMDQ